MERLRYGGRGWFAAAPDDLEADRNARRHVSVAGLVLIRTVREEEAEYVWEHMRREEWEEGAEVVRDAAEARAAHRRAVLSARVSYAAYHGASLLAVLTLDEKSPGKWFLTMERTVHAMEVGHRFTWLRAYGPVAKMLVRKCAAASGGGFDGIYFVTPTDMPRALDVYRHAGAARVSDVKVGSRDYWLMRIGSGAAGRAAKTEGGRDGG